MNSKGRSSLEKARDYAFLLLKFRLRSEKEIYERLKKKKFGEGIIRAVLSFLKEKSFIDDGLFAKLWIESRLRKPLGLRRIRQELTLKGIDKEIIEGQLSSIKEGYCEEDLVLKIAREKTNKLKGNDPVKIKRRIYSFLLRRGFSPHVVTEAMNNL